MKLKYIYIIAVILFFSLSSFAIPDTKTVVLNFDEIISIKNIFKDIVAGGNKGGQVNSISGGGEDYTKGMDIISGGGEDYTKGMDIISGGGEDYTKGMDIISGGGEDYTKGMDVFVTDEFGNKIEVTNYYIKDGKLYIEMNNTGGGRVIIVIVNKKNGNSVTVSHGG